jgi:hypothetical protein
VCWTCSWNWLFFLKCEFGKVLLSSCLMVLSVFSLVLAVDRGDLKSLYLCLINGILANEFVNVSWITAQISPGKNLFSALSDFGSEV